MLILLDQEGKFSTVGDPMPLDKNGWIADVEGRR